MTQDRYLTMCEQMGHEIDLDKMPPDLIDLPFIMQAAIATFNMMGDRVQSDIGYIGKDYTNLQHYIGLYEVEDLEFFLEILSWLDSRAIKKSSERLKKELAAAKSK